MVSFARPDQIGLAAEVSASFALDNGAFSVWRQGLKPDWEGYADWVHGWSYHPGFDWAIIPDSAELGVGESRWISVEEKLPEDDATVLAAIPFYDNDRKLTEVEVLHCTY
jgi:hypothetical protein